MRGVVLVEDKEGGGGERWRGGEGAVLEVEGRARRG